VAPEVYPCQAQQAPRMPGQGSRRLSWSRHAASYFPVEEIRLFVGLCECQEGFQVEKLQVSCEF